MVRLPSQGRRTRGGRSRQVVLAAVIVVGGLVATRIVLRSPEDAPAPALSHAESPAIPPQEVPVPPPAPGPTEKADLQEHAQTPAEAPEEALRRVEGEARALRQAGQDEALRRLLGAAVLDPRLPAGVRRSWWPELEALNGRLVWTPVQAAGFVTEEIRAGDSYWTICRRIRQASGTPLTPGLLERLNRVSPERLRPGRTLKVPEHPVSLLVDKSDFALYVLHDGLCVLTYEVGIGRDDRTPDGRFTLGGKAKRPDWTDPSSGKTYRHGEPGHLIGSRWIRFFDAGAGTAYGIHGTVDPGTIGRAASEGCIRMNNPDVEELFELVADGTLVDVRP